MKIRNLFAAGFLGLFAFILSAQQPAPVPSKPAAKAQSPAETMKFLQEKLNHVGRLDFVDHIQDKEEGNATVKLSLEMSNVVADPASCTIKYHFKESMHGDIVHDEDVSLSLRAVLGLSMLTDVEHDNLLFEREKAYPGEPRVRFERFEPAAYMVVMRMVGDNEEGFLFADRKMANQVARAMSHAVELCGGKNGPY